MQKLVEVNMKYSEYIREWLDQAPMFAIFIKIKIVNLPYQMTISNLKQIMTFQIFSCGLRAARACHTPLRRCVAAADIL